MKIYLASLPFFAFAVGAASGQNLLSRSDDGIVDFSNFGVGESVTLLDYGISVTAQKRQYKDGPFIDATAMIFDSENPPEADKDLGTPNRDFGGPGVGPEGRKGQPHENAEPQGNVLIISQDDDPSGPNDHRFGGYVLFEFETPMILKEIGLLDNEEDTEFDVERVDNEPQIMLDNEGGDNSFEIVSLGDAVASKLKVTFGGSGAITYLKVAPLTDSPTLSPTVLTDAPTSGVADALVSTTSAPTGETTDAPTGLPTASPVAPTDQPTSLVTESPTKSPVAPTNSPTTSPTESPTASPVAPTDGPTGLPTASPVAPTDQPTSLVTESPTVSPVAPTDSPTLAPTKSPTASPVTPTDQPTASPTPYPPTPLTLPPTSLGEFIGPPLPIEGEDDCLVLGFSLWNTISSTEITPIANGSEVCLEDLDPRGVTVKAIVDDCAESVTFDLFTDAGDFWTTTDAGDFSTTTDTEADFLLEDSDFVAGVSYMLFASTNDSAVVTDLSFTVIPCDEVRI